MPGQHSNPTIAFRPTQWERAMIEERVKASGLYKKDFIARSCIYSNIVVVGTKQRVQYLVEELRETQIVMKEITEQILSGMCTADSSWSVALLRYFNPIGAHESGRIGEDPRGIPNNLMPFITQVAVGRREFLSVYGNDYPTPDGTGVRDYIHVVDLAKGHVAAVRYVTEHTGCEVFNLGTGVGYSVLEMVKTFERANNLTLPYKIVDRRPGDLPTCYADPSKSAEILGWRAEKNLEDMCRDSWRWQSRNPMGYAD